MSLIITLVGRNDQDAVIKNRFLGFLIWQCISSTSIYTLSKTLLFSLFITQPLLKSPLSFLTILFSFLLFHLSLILFSTSIFLISSPHPDCGASPFDLGLSIVRLIFFSGSHPIPSDLRHWARVSLGFVFFLAVSGVCGFVSLLCVCWSFNSVQPGRVVIGTIGFRGFAVGLFYGLYYIYKRRWVLQFPIIQRPPFFSFKMWLPSAIGQSLKLSSVGYLFSAVLAHFLPNEFKNMVTMGKFIVEQIIFYIGSFMVFLCWELCHCLLQVLHTKRFIFAPSKGSAAAETNPSQHLLAVLEESMPKSLLQYLAYLDLSMVCESNADTWRRAAFFQETGDTYKRVVAVCLRPLEQLTLKLGEGLENCSVDNSFQLTHQLCSSTERFADSRQYEPFCDFQLCAWCARIVASLTVHSHKEDIFGVAQLSGSNAAVVSTLMSCLLAVETFMGKKTSIQSPYYLMGPAGIKWAMLRTGKRDVAASVMWKRCSPLYSKAYAVADMLRTSMFCIVSAFHDEMLKSAKAGLIEKDWIINSKPLYGSRELLLQKFSLFLDFRAS